MGYELNIDRQKYQKCDNCLFNKGCYVQEMQKEQEASGVGNDCLLYQDERDLPSFQRTARYPNVKDLPTYTVRIRRPI